MSFDLIIFQGKTEIKIRLGIPFCHSPTLDLLSFLALTHIFVADLLDFFRLEMYSFLCLINSLARYENYFHSRS